MKEYGTVKVVIPNEERVPRPEAAYWEARKQAAVMGGTLTGVVSVSRSDDFMSDSTTYLFEMEREVEGS